MSMINGFSFVSIIEVEPKKRHVLDVMFDDGFRLTFDMMNGTDPSAILKEMNLEIQLRQSKQNIYDSRVATVVDCISKSITDEEGLVDLSLPIRKDPWMRAILQYILIENKITHDMAYEALKDHYGVT